MTRLRE